MVNLRNQQTEFEAAKVTPVVIVMATPMQAAPVVEKLRFPFTVLCDPEQIAYQHFEIPRGRPWQYLGPKMWLAGARAVVRGGMGKPLNDITQMHGTLVIDTDGEVIYRRHGEHSADYITAAEVISALK